jgi:DNA-binding response OmpR family regulator
VRLPLERDLASPAADQAAPQSVMTAVGARRILVVDDHVDAANALAVLLRQQGHTVTVAHGGEAALAAAKEFVPEVALLDLGMPGLSGFDVGRLLRRQLGAEVFLVAVSGYSGTDYRRGATEAGIDEYVVKPLDVAALDDLLIRRSR